MTQTFDIDFKIRLTVEVFAAPSSTIVEEPDEPVVDPKITEKGGGPAKTPRKRTTPTLVPSPTPNPATPTPTTGGTGGDQPNLPDNGGEQAGKDGSP